MKRKVSIRIEPPGIQKRVYPGTPLRDILFEYGVEFPCGGKGTCGRCRVKVVKGQVDTTPDHEACRKNLGLPENYRLACMSHITQEAILEIEQYQAFILADNTAFDFIPQEGYGIAIDLGTTTVVAQLVDLRTGRVLDTRSARNPQAKHGADIMSRIDFAVNRNGIGILQREIRGTIAGMIKELTPETGRDVARITLVSNTVMQHIYCGIDLRPLSMYPFESVCHTTFEFTPKEVGITDVPNARIIFLPSIGSFVGSDILAGIMAADIHHRKTTFALIDLGTNGEIAAGNREGILCASTAAGPAFEGTNISMGMTASAGAISSVQVTGGKITCHAIANEKPRGVCGSGLIDAITLFLQEGIIDTGGLVRTGQGSLHLAGKVSLTQGDIRELQLAKAAIAAGMEILASRLGISLPAIEHLFIAGAFGTFINLANAIRIGLLEVPEGKITRLGNSALIGAKMALFQKQEDWDEILKITRHISLESSREFQDVFVSKMSFA